MERVKESAMVIQTRITAREFLALPETMLPHELIEGEEIMSPAPSVDHQRLIARVYELIRQIAPNGEVFLSPVDIYLDDDNVVQPDVFWVSQGGACVISQDRNYMRGAPDLVVEVISPGSVYHDRKKKFRLYERFNVREYWIITPADKLIEVWTGSTGHFDFIDVYNAADRLVSPLLGEAAVNTIFPD
jgi:Uma2 family endonuclease